MTPAYLALALGVAVVLVAWDLQRRWFERAEILRKDAERASSREHEIKLLQQAETAVARELSAAQATAASEREYAFRLTQRDFEANSVKEMLVEVQPLIEGQNARDQRNDKALAAFLTELRELVKSLHTTAQKQSTETVSKLQAMSRMGTRRP